MDINNFNHEFDFVVSDYYKGKKIDYKRIIENAKKEIKLRE